MYFLFILSDEIRPLKIILSAELWNAMVTEF